MSLSSSTRAEVVRSALLPTLWLFVLPFFTLWFGHHVEADLDEQLHAAFREQLGAATDLSAEERAAANAIIDTFSGGEVCESDAPETAGLREHLSEVCGDYAQVRWMQRLGWGSIGLGLLTGLLAGGCVALAWARRSAQILAFQAGWNLLRVTSALQVAAQGVMALALSYWMTAFWLHVYVIKLIFLVGALSAVALFGVIKAIFARVDLVTEVDGALIDEPRAPALWARLRELAARVGTAPPDRIFGGIDDNFFVTEGRVANAGQLYEGRTLFVSLSLLRGLDRTEADAVLAHELAHFSGGDTDHTRRLVPLEARYVRYLEALHSNPLARPAFYPMNAFWVLFQIASKASHRERELRADRVAADLTSAEAISHALLKIAAYATFRGRVEQELFGQQQVLTELGIVERVRSGFQSYVRSDELNATLAEVRTPHPMDSHPSNLERYAALGVSLPPRTWADLLSRPVEETWLDAITGAAEIEARLWREYEARFAQNHELKLAYTTTPQTAEQRALVERHFPALGFVNKEGGTAIEVSWQDINLYEWERPVAFEHITGAKVEESMLGDKLIIEVVPPGGKKETWKIKIGVLKDKDGFLAVFNQYWGRSQVAKKHREG